MHWRGIATNFFTSVVLRFMASAIFPRASSSVEVYITASNPVTFDKNVSNDKTLWLHNIKFSDNSTLNVN